MKKILLTLMFMVGGIAGANAVCAPPAVMHDFPGTAFNMSMATAADGNCASSVTVQSGGVASGAIASGAVAAGALASGSGVDGWDLTQGTKADAAWVSGSGSVISILKNIAGGVAGSIPAGSAIIGKVGIDQTTPGTTNGVQVNAAIPAGTNTIGNVGSDPSSGKATPTEAFLALPATTTTQIIALSGSTKTYITSAVVLAGGTVNVTFKYGTGSNCGTGTTTLNGPWPLTAQAGFTKGSGTGAVMIVPAGQALCITTDASVSGGVDLTYQQF